jgi:hypothetical protein
MRGFRRRRKPRVMWADVPQVTDISTVYSMATGAPPIQTVTALGQATAASLDDKWDVPFDRQGAITLGVSDWGTLESSMTQPGYKLVRLVGNWNWAMAQVIQGATGMGADARIINSVVRVGLFIGEADEAGGFEAGNEFDMASNAKSGWKRERWLYLRQWVLSNQSGYCPTPQTVVRGSNVANQLSAFLGPQANWEFAGSGSNHMVDIKPNVSIGRDQRLFIKRQIFDLAAGSSSAAAATGVAGWLEHFTFRMLVARGGARRTRS